MNTFNVLCASNVSRRTGFGDGPHPGSGGGYVSYRGDGHGQGQRRLAATEGSGHGSGSTRILLCIDVNHLRARAINLVVRMQPP